MGALKLNASKAILPAILVLLPMFAEAQKQTPVQWYFRSETLTHGENSMIATAVMAPGWHIYSQFMESGGPIPTHFLFDKSELYTRVGNVEEKSMPIKFQDSIFMIEIRWFSEVAVFAQKIKLFAPEAFITGTVTYMVCNNYTCLPEEKQLFHVAIQNVK